MAGPKNSSAPDAASGGRTANSPPPAASDSGVLDSADMMSPTDIKIKVQPAPDQPSEEVARTQYDEASDPMVAGDEEHLAAAPNPDVDAADLLEAPANPALVDNSPSLDPTVHPELAKRAPAMIPGVDEADALRDDAPSLSPPVKSVGANYSHSISLDTGLSAKLGSTPPGSPTKCRRLKRPRTASLKDDDWWAGILQWHLSHAAVTVFTYTMPTLVAVTFGWLAWTGLVFAWIMMDILTPVLEALSFSPRAMNHYVSEALNVVIATWARWFLWYEDGYDFVHKLEKFVDADEAWGYRKSFVLVGFLWCAFIVAYTFRVSTDKRSKRSSKGRRIFVHKWAFFRVSRTYFSPHVYFDVAPKHLRFQNVNAMTGRPLSEMLDAIDRAFPTRDERTFEYRTYLFCCHPHGLLSFSVWASFVIWNRLMFKAFDQRGFVMTIHTLAANFRVPGWRELFLALRFSDVSRQALVHALGGEAADYIKTQDKNKGDDKSKDDEKKPTTDDKTDEKGEEAASPATADPAETNARGGSVPGASSSATEFARHPSRKMQHREHDDVDDDSASTSGPLQSQHHQKHKIVDHHFDEPRISVMVPGGAAESVTCTEPRLTLAKRKGFVRVAMSTGSDLVPIYTFGETDLYRPIPGAQNPWLIRTLLKIQKVLGVGTPLIVGDNVFNIFTPRRGVLHTVIGKPISTRRYWKGSADDDDDTDEPFFTDEDVDAAHAEYVDAIKDLYRRYQPELDPSGPAELDIIDDDAK